MPTCRTQSYYMLICMYIMHVVSYIIQPIGYNENSAVEKAIRLSLNSIVDNKSDVLTQQGIDPTKCLNDLQEKIKQHTKIKVQGPERNIVVSRLSIWQTAMPYFKRRGFQSSHGLLCVTFAAFESQEDAIDHGGPSREFFHLLLGAIARESVTLTSKAASMFQL